MLRKALFLFLSLCTLTLSAEERTIDVSGNNTSSDYKSYDQAISLPAGDVLNVKMARYVYFSSTITGSGTLNLYAGGERCYLGTKSGKTWADWIKYTGDIHIFPFKENSSSAGFYGVVLAHGGKSSSPENALDDVKSGKVNSTMVNNRVILHDGATICCEANTAGAGFRIGELQTEVGSTLQGYMKNSRSAYYLLGALNTDATIAGKIAPSGYRDDTALSILKEGTGTYTITGNDNYLSGALRILQGRVLVMNDRDQAEKQKLRGALGAMPSSSSAVAYVFEEGVLGGTGSIGGTVDNYGTIEPGKDAIGLLTLKNYVDNKDANLFVRPASELRFKVASAANHDQLAVDGMVKYFNMAQDFTTSDKMPVIRIVLDEAAEVKVGDTFTLLTAKSKGTNSGDWHFDVKADHYTWAIEEHEADGVYTVTATLVSLEDAGHSVDPDDPSQQEGTMGAYYDDGIDDNADTTPLRDYAQRNGKQIGTAISLWKNDLTNANLSESKEVGAQFNMLVAENEMKFDALQPSRGSFTYGSADALVNYAQKHNMVMRGHCLVWHQQQPEWVSSDGKKNDKNWTRQEALKIMEDHITNVVRHFKGKVKEWDVVNECLDDDQTTVRSNPDAFDLRATVWQRAIGDDYIDSAFVYAHRADPSALLYLNDYGVELQGKAKSVAFYNLAMRLKNNNIPIHGVGLQCHFSIGEVDSTKLDNTIRRFGEAGLKCIITELDMGIPSTSQANLEEQARNYRVITDIVLNNDNCPNMVIWGLKDNNSWRDSNPLLYTAGLGRKPAWKAVRSALRHRVLEDKSKFHVYLCFGQSNMEGNAQWESVDNQYVDPRFQMLATTDFDNPKRKMGEWYTAYCPIVSPMGKLGMADYFGRTMVAALPVDVKVGVVAVAMGGSPIEMFDKDKYQQKLAANPNEWWATLSKNYYGGNPYGRLVEMAKKAQEVGVIKGILLHQGCSNNGDPNWPNMVKKIYNDLLNDLGLNAADVPLFAGETEREDMGGGCYHHNAVVARLPQVIPTAHVVSSENIPGNGDDPWHFSAAGYRIFGKRYAIETLKVMGLEAKANPEYNMPTNLKNFFTPRSFVTTLRGKAGSTLTLKLVCTFADGHSEDITRETTFSSSDYTIANNKVKLGEEGTSGTVMATFTDFLGTVHDVSLNIEVGEGTGLTRLTSVPEIEGQNIIIMSEDDGRVFYGSDNQNLGFDDPSKVFDNTSIVGYQFKAEPLAGTTNHYLLRLITLNGSPYSIWGNPGYLNSQPADGWCSFILGLNNQNGQDIKDGAVWEIEYVENMGFTLKNVGTGLYLKDAAPAKYDTPAYFAFCVPGGQSGITTIEQRHANADIYNLQGMKAGKMAQWETLPRGLYIVNGIKIFKP